MAPLPQLIEPSVALKAYLVTTAEEIEAFGALVMAKVDKSENGTGCWVWRGPINQYGYGFMPIQSQFGSIGAHRLVWEILVGQIPSGLSIDHLCLNKLCVNPAHLELVTRGENSRRAMKNRERVRGLRRVIAEADERDRMVT
jgi:hypothetical protein